MKITKIITIIFLPLVLFPNVFSQSLKVSANHRFFAQKNEKPFFWLGDTGWLLFKKCTREEILKYLETRQRQGFNVIQVMLLHDLKEATNVYRRAALENTDVSRPLVTPGNNFNNKDEYDYWDHIEWTVDEAARRGLYLALVPVWGSNVKSGLVNVSQAGTYAAFLAERFKDKPNIIWLNGGDLMGSDNAEVWKAIGTALRERDPNHLITFHPRGRHSSSEWFHHESWLDFNMFQSGHRNYAQDNSPDEKLHYGEDNWRYAAADYRLDPVKPTIDGEPSYENIPQGLHDSRLPRWTAADVRRYAYWSVLAGGAGFTYGENSVMQFYKAGEKNPAYGAAEDWRETINSPGANQLRFLKKLILSKPYFERVPAPELVANQGERYSFIAAAKGENYAFFYTYTGREIKVAIGKLPGKKLKCSWYNPRNGQTLPIGKIENGEIKSFDPPGEEKEGNDWVLIMQSAIFIDFFGFV